MDTISDPTPPPDPPDGQEPASKRFEYVHSKGFARLLRSLGVSLLVSTYQAGKLMAVRADEQGGVSTLLRSFEYAMGLAVAPTRLAIGSRRQIWVLRSASDIAAKLPPEGTHDTCYVPRSSHVTGDIRIHELAWGQPVPDASGQTTPQLWFVNTRFSCLCTLHPDFSFYPRWRPKFITQLAAEDRCHLNGLAMVNGQPRLATALGTTNTAQGWREDKVYGGVLIDVPANEVVTTGLCMPHSPRVYDGKIWVLNSGRGELQVVDPDSGSRQTVVRLMGYTRGLAFHENYAFIATSKIREKREFGGLPIEENITDLRCGVYAVQLDTGQVEGYIEFKSGCTEIFDVQVLAQCHWPAVIGFQKDTIDGIFIVPPVRTTHPSLDSP